MKIKYIVNARIPTEKAHGYQITKMCEMFAVLGNDVELIVPTRDNPIKDDVFAYYNLKNNFKIRYIKSYDFLRFVRIFGRFSFYAQSLWFLFKLIFVKINKDAIVYTRNPEIVWLFSLRGYQTAYECHDWFKKSKNIALFLLKKLDYLITTNNFIKQEFEKNNWKKNILVAPNGIDLSIFSLKINKEQALQKLLIDDKFKDILKQKNVLLYTGSFRTMGESKGIDEILSALKILKNNKIIFVAVGGNENDIGFYTKKAKELGVLNQTLFLPKVKQKQLAYWQKVSDILLMPFPDKAHYRYHMTPLKTFEYMASGVPILASDLPSIKEILNEQNAFFCKAGDIYDLAEKIEKVLGDKNKVKEKAEQALKGVGKFSIYNRAKTILKFCNVYK